MTLAETDMKLCVIKRFKAANSLMKPKAFPSICALDFGSCFNEKYQLKVMSRMQRPRLTLRHWANRFFLNRFIHLLQQNSFINQIRLPYVGLHLTTILNSKPFSYEDHRSDLRNKSKNAATRIWQSVRVPGYFLRNIHANSAAFIIPNYADILHPDYHSQGQPLLQMWLRQARSISSLIKRQLSKWQSSMHPLIGHGMSAFRELLADSNLRTDVSPDVGPTSLDFGRPDPGRPHIKPAPLTFQLMSGQAPKHHDFLNRTLQNFNGELFDRRSNDIYPQSVIGSLYGDPAHFLPPATNKISTTFYTPHGGILPKMHFRRRNRRFHVKNGFPATVANGDWYKYDEEIEEKILNRHLTILSPLTLQPFRRLRANRLIETDEHETLRISGQTDEKKQKVPPAFIDKRWMNRHIRVQTDFPATTTNGDRYNYDEEIEEKILNRHLSTLSHLTLRPFRRWPNLLLETEERETLRSPGQSDEENLKAPAAFIDKRIRYLTDKSSRENNVFSMLRPPKMKLAVSERKAAPDLRGELQNIERRLKSIKPTESSPPQSNIDIHQISERVYDEIERKLRIERERRGL